MLFEIFYVCLLLLQFHFSLFLFSSFSWFWIFIKAINKMYNIKGKRSSNSYFQAISLVILKNSYENDIALLPFILIVSVLPHCTCQNAVRNNSISCCPSSSVSSIIHHSFGNYFCEIWLIYYFCRMVYELFRLRNLSVINQKIRTFHLKFINLKFMILFMNKLNTELI